MVFSSMDSFGLEELVFCNDKRTGLKAIIAIHDTTLGPAMGGTRMKVYANEEEALQDAVSLARAMTYKSAAAGLDLGGGKAVIMGDPALSKNEALLRAYGRFVERLGGRYITSVDAGINEYDVDCIRRETLFALGGTAFGGCGGCPSPATAYGVWQGMKACAEAEFGSPELADLTIAVQGLGSVGRVLCEYLKSEGARLIVTDIDINCRKLAEEWQAEWVLPQEIHKVPCDIFAPCALGGAVNEKTLPELVCRIVAGAANNVLSGDNMADELHKKGIIYAPDYIINAGGLIYIAHERTRYLPGEIMEIVGRIRGRLGQILKRAAGEGVTPFLVARQMAEERINAAKGLLSLRATFRRD
ncbi:MAG: Glu/Leu/Phe/Val dehydrogenase [Dethiobacter sp.]|nr:Glu/Leu/Phe/Val dehydrogenase [Dethiobacter sp.]